MLQWHGGNNSKLFIYYQTLKHSLISSSLDQSPLPRKKKKNKTTQVFTNNKPSFNAKASKNILN